MSKQDNIQVVQGVCATFGSGDVAAFLDLWVEDCAYHVPGPPDILPWAGTLRMRGFKISWSDSGIMPTRA